MHLQGWQSVVLGIYFVPAMYKIYVYDSQFLLRSRFDLFNQIYLSLSPCQGAEVSLAINMRCHLRGDSIVTNKTPATECIGPRAAFEIFTWISLWVLIVILPCNLVVGAVSFSLMSALYLSSLCYGIGVPCRTAVL